MATEGATYISDLTSNTPAGTASPAEGDDEIRQLKAVLKATLAGASGTGLAGAVTASHTELNILDGATLSTAELNILDGVTSTAAELNLVDGSTAGTVVNSKAVVYGAAGQVAATTLEAVQYTETVYAPSAGSAFTVDLANGSVQKLTTNANATITLPASVSGKSYVIIVAYGGTHTLTWAGGGTIKWSGGAEPTETSANGKFDIFSFFCDGTNTYAQAVGLNY